MPRPKGSGNRSELVQLALVGIDTQIQQLQAQIAELTEKRKQLAKGGSTVAAVKSASTAEGAKKRVVSAATKKKLKEAAKARWAKVRAEKEGKK